MNKIILLSYYIWLAIKSNVIQAVVVFLFLFFYIMFMSVLHYITIYIITSSRAVIHVCPVSHYMILFTHTDILDYCCFSAEEKRYFCI